MTDKDAGQPLAQKVVNLTAALDTCHRREQYYRRLFDAALAAYALADITVDQRGKPVDCRFREVNERFAQLLRLTPEAVIGKSVCELIPDMGPHWIDTYNKVAHTGQTLRFETCVEKLGKRWFEVFAFSPAPREFMHVLFDISPRKQAEAKLDYQLRFSQVLLDAIPVPVFYKNLAGIYLGGNRAFAAYLGRPLETIIGRTVYDVAPAHLADVYRRADEELLGHGGKQMYEARVRYADGTEHDVMFYKTTISLTDSEKDGLIGIIFDISDRKRMEQGLRESEARFRRQATELETVYRSAPVGLAVLDHELRYRRLNEGLAQINGLPVEAHLGKKVRDIVPSIGDTVEALGKQIFATGEAIRNFEFHSELPNRFGVERFFLSHWEPLKDETDRVWGINVVLEDTTERKQMEERTRHMAQHDSLTDLPNRRLLLELLDAELRKAQRNRRKVALLFLDLDRFKVINDTHGHEAGDAVLKTVADRLMERVRRSDVVARLGGDEFAVLLPGLMRAEQAGEIAAAVLRAFQLPIRWLDHALHVTTSIGIGLYPNDVDNAGGLLRCADMAMYEAKEQGRNTLRFYNPAIGRRAQERLSVENRLREALQNGGLSLCYQPEIELRTGRVMGIEALIRWHHPEWGLLDPARFLPLAEETDLISELDDWVLQAACAQARDWLDRGLRFAHVGVNLSAKRFASPNLVETIRHCLAEQGLAPEHLKLDLAERTIMDQVDRTVERVRDLVALGIGIAVDDFGTGCSSLKYLKRLPIAQIKIDRSLVRDIAIDADDRAVVQAMTGLAHTLNKRVIAEGVETQAQRDFLDAAGCDEAQGFLFTIPLPPEQLGKLLVQ